MDKNKLIKWTGIFGLIGGLLLLLEIPLWIIPGDAGPISNAILHRAFLNKISTIAFTRIFMDILMYMCWMVLFIGIRQLIIFKNKEFEWIGTLSLAAGIVWWSVSLVADGLEGAAILLSLEENVNVEVVKALVYGTLLIYNGSIAFAVTGFYMALVGYAILATNILPKWIGWLSWFSFITCILAIPAMYGGKADTYGFYNIAGWGPTIVANIPPLIWMFAVSIKMIQLSKKRL
ncbi:MAG: hypothetical protein KJ607_02855 [Bacteroidetes bacterium]|nr:hypothetical protein [Bacteroidota bacterium]